MKIFKNKSFFLKSIFLHIFLSIIAIGISWNLFEPSAYNFMMKNFITNKSGDPNIALIVIDDKSIERHRWPWSRELYAEIFEYLQYACQILDLPKVPDLYIQWEYGINAFTVGSENPIVVLNSGLIDLCDDDEIIAPSS